VDGGGERERQLFFAICVSAKEREREREREREELFFPVLFIQMRRGNTDIQRSFFFPHFDSGFWGVEFRREKPYCWI
jgi:hypothetical protein